MNPRPSRCLGLMTLLVILCTSTFLLGELPFGKKKDKDAPAARPSDQPPVLSENDKKKMAEIADRPEVKDEIQAAWDAKRQDDLEFAYNVNSSLHFADVYGPNFAEFRAKYGQLYNNPILQQYLNNIGQRLVPKDSPNVYSFKLLLDPVPRAESYSTGSVYISTGLVSLLDNEAQLAYVLGHEIAHVEKNHFYNEIRNQILEQELNKERAKDAEKKRAIFSAVATGIGAGIGGIAGGGRGAVLGAGIGLGGGYVSSLFLFRTKTTNTEWSTLYENEADEAGFKYMLDENYDVREVPRLYVRLDNMVTRDARIGLGFIGKLSRVKERSANAQNLLSGTYKAQLDARLKAAGLIGSTPEFPLLMAALRRDNGIIALDYDLFAMARDNLEEAVGLRSNDARAQLYLGKVISATARTPADRQEGLAHFLKAIEYDEGRGAYPDPHLEHALSLIAQNNSADWDEIKKELQTYVALYQREHMGQLPNNMPILYDYFTLAGDATWYVPPVAVISTKNVEALRVNTSGEMAAASAKEVADTATSAGIPAPLVIKTPAPRSKQKTVPVSAPH
jgi:Zn-dependent protease with chaperone function